MPRNWAKVVRSCAELRSLATKLEDSHLPLSALVHLLESHEANTIKIVSSICGSPEMARNLNHYLAGNGNLKPALKGGDLLEMGVPRGPMLGRMLADLRDMRLDRRVNSEEGRTPMGEASRWRPRKAAAAVKEEDRRGAHSGGGEPECKKYWNASHASSVKTPWMVSTIPRARCAVESFTSRGARTARFPRCGRISSHEEALAVVYLCNDCYEGRRP